MNMSYKLNMKDQMKAVVLADSTIDDDDKLNELMFELVYLRNAAKSAILIMKACQELPCVNDGFKEQIQFRIDLLTPKEELTK